MVRAVESFVYSDVITGSEPDVDKASRDRAGADARAAVYATIVNVSRCGFDRPAVLVAMIVTV